jgi:hypothetical protein
MDGERMNGLGRDGTGRAVEYVSTETTETLLWYLVGGRFGRMSEAVSQHAFLPPLFGTYPEQDARPAPTAPPPWLDSTRLGSSLLSWPSISISLCHHSQTAQRTLGGYGSCTAR